LSGFVKGKDWRNSGGNPNGRPKGSKNKYSLSDLKDSIEKIEKKKGKKLLEHFVQEAYDNPVVLIALMKKVLPDLKAIEGVVAVDSSMSDELANMIRDRLKERYE
jgi:hypothetical protein